MEENPAARTLSAEKRALQIRRLRPDADVRALLMSEPLAIIGMGCRFPGGADDPDGFWRLLSEGRDVLGPAPEGRWFGDGGHPRGYYVAGIDGLDLGFFGLSAREAAGIDPQQRLLLEVAIEALDDAGLPRARLAGSRTGVFVGACVSDYARHALASGREPDAYAVSGIADSILANRLSYLLDLTGPSLAVDTACSSSLVALHLACQSLRTGESDMAIVGGVNLILGPEVGEALERAGMLAPDGRCKTFAADADGFARGEGAGALVVRRLVDAMAAGDRIHAVIRGTAMNQDGRSNGLTAPNPLAQERVIRAALDNAGVAPEAVGYVEAHGTGTALGDPIEVQALRAVYSVPGRASPLRIGAAKAGIGHLEGASGVAGLIKATLCLKHGRIPRQPHFSRPNPNFGPEFDLHIPTRDEDWRAGEDGQRRFAGVSAFGFGGTNVHVVLEETPPGLVHASLAPATAEPALLVVTAADPAALVVRARQTAAFLEAGTDPHAVQSTLAQRSSHLAHRLAVTGPGRDLAASLRAAAEGAAGPDIAVGRARGQGAGPVFVFSGQGGQWAGMGAGLLGLPVFRAALEACDAALVAKAGWSVLDVLHGRDPSRDLARTEVAQPVLVAVQIALAALLRSLGVAPAAVIGHSVGEIAAACVAGMLDVPQAMAIAAMRGALMADLAGQGGMVALDLSPDEIRPALVGLDVDIAALNGPRATVLSGTGDALDAALDRLGAPHRRLAGAYAFHGRQTAPAVAALAHDLAGLVPSPPSLTMISTVTATAVTRPDAAYWASNAREPVMFSAAAGVLMEAGHTTFIEIGPHPVLLSALVQSWGARGGEPDDLCAVGTLRRATDDRLSLLRTAGRLFVRGADLDWPALGISGGRFAPLPAYPWQRTRCWLPDAAAAPREPGSPALYAVGFDPAPRRATSRIPDGAWAVSGTGSTLQDALAASLGPAEGAAQRVAVFAGVEGTAEAAIDACDRCLDEIRRPAATPLWLITGDPATDPAAAAIWGLAESALWEAPGRIAGIIGVAGSVSKAEVTAVLDELADATRVGSTGLRIVLDGTARHVPALRKVDPTANRGPAIDPEGAYLVTGGLGGLGLACAGWLADLGARHLVLAGRRPPSPQAEAILDDLRHRGIAVEVTASDIADPQAIARLLDGFGTVRPRLRGVIHAAGVLRDSLLNGQDRAALAEIFAAKAGGAETLLRLAARHEPDFLVLMSSLAGLFGAQGQAGYAAANAFVDALARRHRASGAPVVSIAWGPWREAGMAAQLGASGAGRRHDHGIGALATREALDLMGQALGGTEPVTAALRMDWPRFAATLPAGSGPLATSVTVRASAGHEPAPLPVRPDTDARAGLLALPPLARRGRMRTLVGDALSAVMGGQRPDPARGFFDQGMDSLMAVEFRTRLELLLGCPVGTTAVFEHATVVALSDHLLRIVERDDVPRAGPDAAPGHVSDTLADLRAALAASGGAAADVRKT